MFGIVRAGIGPAAVVPAISCITHIKFDESAARGDQDGVVEVVPRRSASAALLRHLALNPPGSA